MPYIKWSQQEETILKNHWHSALAGIISDLLPNKTWSSIQHKAHRLNLKRDQTSTNVSFSKRNSFIGGNSMIYKLLDDNCETFYWIGYIFADGSIYRNKDGKWCFNLCSSEKDICHIEKFRKLINKNKITIKKRISGFSGSDLAVVEFKDRDILPKLMIKFCLNENKTYHPPDNVKIQDDDLFVSLFIGYLDGDGCITKKGEIVVNCNYSWKKLLDEWFLRVWNLSNCKLGERNIKIPVGSRKITPYQDQVSIGTMNKNFTNFLKNGALRLNLPVMKRKWDRIR